MVAVTEETFFVTVDTIDTNVSYNNNNEPLEAMNWDRFLCIFSHFSFNDTGLDLYCGADWDDVRCWPPTKAGHVANESCPFWEKHNSTADIVRAYRICKEDGMWENFSDYNHCLNYSIAAPTFPVSYQPARILSIIYMSFCCISLFLLLISLFIFYYFKSLQCTRVAIHKNLFVSFALKYIVFILVIYSTANDDYFDYTGTPPSPSILQTPVVCRLTLILAQYFGMVNIFWMLNEGVFLTSRIAIAVFSTKSNLKLYFIVGWGYPIVFVVIWAVLMSLNFDGCWNNYVDSNFLLILSVPQFVAFLLNMIILINIIRILITKLRASHAVETNQVRKAVKATVVLLPLLGVALMLSFWQYPGDENHTYHFVFSVVISTQGMFVAVIYCFLNTEVQMTIKRKLKRINVMKKTRGPGRRMQASSPASFMVATSSEVVLPMSYRKKTATSIDNPFWPEHSEALKEQSVQSNEKEVIDNNENNNICPNV
ncbi:calcitonin gene-related peptide type 1 receptor-like isoform X2 [Antedon mediterranea]